MRLTSLLAFFALSLAAPFLQDRNLKIFTVTDWEIETVTSYTTVWGSPVSSISTPSSLSTMVSSVSSAEQRHHSRTTQPPIQSTTTSVAAVPTTTSSAVVDPSTATSSAAAEPSTSISTSAPAIQPTISTSSAPSAQTTSPSSGNTYPVTKLDGASASDGPCTAGQLCSGDITHFNPSMGLGACGYKDWDSKTIWQDTDYVVAVSANIMGSFSNGGTPDSVNELCKRSVHIKAQDGGQDIVARVVDKCPTCPGNFDLDLSPVVFDKVAPKGDGRVHNVEWFWV